VYTMEIGIIVVIVVVSVIGGLMFLSCIFAPRTRSMTGRGPNTPW
jgi:hypothetical protein